MGARGLSPRCCPCLGERVVSVHRACGGQAFGCSWCFLPPGRILLESGWLGGSIKGTGSNRPADGAARVRIAWKPQPRRLGWRNGTGRRPAAGRPAGSVWSSRPGIAVRGLPAHDRPMDMAGVPIDEAAHASMIAVSHHRLRARPIDGQRSASGPVEAGWTVRVHCKWTAPSRLISQPRSDPALPASPGYWLSRGFHISHPCNVADEARLLEFPQGGSRT